MDTLVAAIDIGGTKIAATVADKSGPLGRVAAPTPRTGTRDALAERAIALVDEVCAQAGVDAAQVRTAGVSSCGPFLKQDGAIALVPPNLCGAGRNSPDLDNDWESIPVEQGLRRRFEHVAIENDCVAALIAERTFGALQGQDHCAYVTWSTGVGFGLCLDGRILRGKNGNAGHAGHMLLSETSDALCGCGNRGDLEALVAGRNLGNRLGRPVAEVFQLAREGDAAAVRIVSDAARWFGRGLYNLTTSLDLQAFSIGGSVWLHNADLLLPLVQREIAAHFPPLTEGVVVQTAGLGAMVGDLAALSLVLPEDWVGEWRAASPWRRMSSPA